MASSSRDSCVLEMGLEDLYDQTPIMMYTSIDRQDQEISFLDALSTAVITVATRVTHAGSSLYSTVQAAVTGVTSFLGHNEDELLPLRYNARFPPPVPPPISESLLSGPEQVRPPVRPVSRTQYEGHWRPWLDQSPRQEYWHRGADMEDRGPVAPHQQGISSYRRYHSNSYPWQSTPNYGSYLPIPTSDYSVDRPVGESPVMSQSPFRHRWHMAPGHLPYQFPMPEQPYPSHFYGDGQRSPGASGHLPYSTHGPSQQCHYSDVYGTTGVPGHLSHSLQTPNVEYHYQGFHGCPGVPGHLLTQAQVHGQQNPYSGPPESPAISSPVADDLYASPTNSVARTPSPGMASSVSSRTTRRRRKQKKVANYDGKTSWEDYYVQFQLVAALNGWDEETKALELATSLRGTAQSILADLDPDKRTDYQSLVSALSARFEPEHQADMYLAEIRTRTRLKSESLPELGQVMKRLARYALPSAPSSVRQWLALTQFTEALDDEFLEYAVKQAKPKTVDEAVKVAMETEAFRLSRRRGKTHKSDIQHLDPIMAISKPKMSRRRHQKGKVPQAKFEPRNQLDPDQDEVSMPEIYDGDGML